MLHSVSFGAKSGTSSKGTLGEESGTSSGKTLGVESLTSSIDPFHSLRRVKSVKTLGCKMEDAYDLIEVLDSGSFGVVSKVRCRRTKGFFAMKSIALDRVPKPELFVRELGIMRRLKHPNIIRLSEYFKDVDAYHLLMDLCTGGNLFDYVTKAAEVDGGPPGQGEKSDAEGPPGPAGLRCCEVSRLLGQMLKGLAYLHNFRFAHRDIKPQNYLLESGTSEAPTLKLVDFGLARSFQASRADKKGTQRMTSVLGTVGYVAPEVLLSKDGYTQLCDVWGVGATAWFLAAGALPFEGKDSHEYLRSVRSQNLRPGEAWKHEHPEELQRVVLRMLEPDSCKRPGAAELLKSACWLRREACPEHGGRGGAGAGAGSAGCCSIQ